MHTKENFALNNMWRSKHHKGTKVRIEKKEWKKESNMEAKIKMTAQNKRTLTFLKKWKTQWFDAVDSWGASGKMKISIVCKRSYLLTSSFSIRKV